MKNKLSLLLKAFAAIALLSALSVWIATGSHRGWTQTSTVEMKTDEITGINYPVRHDGFVAGVEIPALGLLAASTLGGLGFLLGRRPSARS